MKRPLKRADTADGARQSAHLLSVQAQIDAIARGELYEGDPWGKALRCRGPAPPTMLSASLAQLRRQTAADGPSVRTL